jgi:DegV family protein with EDD domain
MKPGIVTDTTSDLPAHLIEQHELEVIPSLVVIDGKEYTDGIGITREEYYKRLPALRTPPTTAAPSIGEFAARYESLLRRGFDHVISIHAAQQLTTIINTARQAAREFPGRVTIVDSTSLSLGIGFQVIAAAEAAERGLQAALDAIESVRKRLHVFAALDTMDNIRRSGRVPAAVTILGGMLHIKPIVELINGEVKPTGALRTTRQANEKMLNLLLQNGELDRLAILHTGAEARAKEFLNMVMEKAIRSMPRDILMLNVTPTIGTHVGPNGLGFASVMK